MKWPATIRITRTSDARLGCIRLQVKWTLLPGFGQPRLGTASYVYQSASAPVAATPTQGWSLTLLSAGVRTHRQLAAFKENFL